MSNYSQITYFAPKDLLQTGNPAKLIKGADVDGELAAIAAAIATKYDTSSTARISAVNAFALGNQVPTAGGLMQVDNQLESTINYHVQTEGGVWSSTTYSYVAISKEFSNSTIPGQMSNSGPMSSLYVFANNNGATATVNGITVDAVARTNSGRVFGSNLIVRNDAGVSGSVLTGLEIDFATPTATTISGQSIGLVLNVFNIASSATVCQIGGNSYGGSWANGFITSSIRGTHYGVLSGDSTTAVSFIDTTNGTFGTSAIKLGTGASQAINLGGQGFGTSPFVYGDSGGNVQVTMGTGGTVVFNEPGGAQRFTFDKFGGFNMPNNGIVKINSVQVLASQITGYGTPTNSTRIANFNASTATAAQTAQLLAALILDLKTHGMIGA